MCGVSLIFWMELHQPKVLKIDLIIFLRTILFRGFLAKRGQNGPKVRFFKFFWKTNAWNLSDF